MKPSRVLLALPAAVALALAACGGGTPPPAPAAPANSAQAQQDYAAFQQLIAAGSDEFAVTMGREVLRKHPGSPAAVEVARLLPEVEARAKADAKRLAALWTYLTNDQRGKRQHTASIHSSVPGSAAERVRLILRRHAEWGQSVYLFDGDGDDRSRQGFVCGKACRLPARIDGVAVALAAHSPETGEPALFIDDDAGFIARLAGGAKTIEIDLRHATRGPFTAVFEVGGYDDPKFLRDP